MPYKLSAPLDPFFTNKSEVNHKYNTQFIKIII